MSKIKIEEHIESIRIWALEGYSEKQIAKKLGISDRTLRRYKSKNQVILSALDNDKIRANMNVELSLLKCALGYEYEEEVITKEKIVSFDEEGRKIVREIPRTIKIKRRVEPNINAQKYWLNNRKVNHWADNPHKTMNNKELLELRKKEIEEKLLL